MDYKLYPKTIGFAEFINSFNVPGLTEDDCRKICYRLHDIVTFRDYIEEDKLENFLLSISIKQKVVDAILKKFNNIDFMLLLEDLEDNKYSLFEEKTYSLKGKKVCITGTLSIPRKMFQSLIEENGGIFHIGIKSDTDILIFSEKDGTKTEKFKQASSINALGKRKIELVTESFFRENLLC